MNKTKKITLSGIFIAIGILLPMVLHFAGSEAGKVFLPMHIPVLLSGFVLGPAYGLGVGVITPLLSSILTGMPPLVTPVPMAVIMIFELGAYGMVSGLLNKKFKLNMICSLLGSMLAGRIAAGIVVAVILYVFGFKNLGNPVIYVWGGIITGLPGIVIQLIVVPAFLTLLKKSRVMQEGSSVDT